MATTRASLRTSRRITESVEISADGLAPSVTGPVWKATLPVGNTTATRRAPRMRSTTDRVVTDVSGAHSLTTSMNAMENAFLQMNHAVDQLSP